jgi:hypothetical protein
MPQPNNAIRTGSFIGLSLLVCLVMLLSLAWPTTAWAGPPEPGYAGPEKCAACHSEETKAWQNSSHAKAMGHLDESLLSARQNGAATDERDCLTCHTTEFDAAIGAYAYAGVSCEACHGAYVEGHPKDGVMNLDVDSSVCRDCHAETHQEWQDSPHAQAGVQCIGCHLSHSQDFRLTDEALCGACHRDKLEDFTHTAHQGADVSCTDCHLSSGSESPGGALASLDPSINHDVPPSHRFSVVSSQACVNCHGKTIHELAPSGEPAQTANVELMTMAERAPELAAELETQEKANQSLQVLAVVSLGLGMGIGGMLGIAFMLILGYVIQGRAKP